MAGPGPRCIVPLSIDSANGHRSLARSLARVFFYPRHTSVHSQRPAREKSHLDTVFFLTHVRGGYTFASTGPCHPPLQGAAEITDTETTDIGVLATTLLCQQSRVLAKRR